MSQDIFDPGLLSCPRVATDVVKAPSELLREQVLDFGIVVEACNRSRQRRHVTPMSEVVNQYPEGRRQKGLRTGRKSKKRLKATRRLISIELLYKPTEDLESAHVWTQVMSVAIFSLPAPGAQLYDWLSVFTKADYSQRDSGN